MSHMIWWHSRVRSPSPNSGSPSNASISFDVPTPSSPRHSTPSSSQLNHHRPLIAIALRVPQAPAELCSFPLAMTSTDYIYIVSTQREDSQRAGSSEITIGENIYTTVAEANLAACELDKALGGSHAQLPDENDSEKWGNRFRRDEDGCVTIRDVEWVLQRDFMMPVTNVQIVVTAGNSP